MKNKSKVDCNLLIAQQKECNMTIGEFCQSNNISASAFKYHLYHGNKMNVEDTDISEDDISFISVEIKKQDTCTDSFIEIRLPSNASIRVDHSTDLSLLKKIMEALQ